MAEVHLTGLGKSHGKQSVLCDLSLRVAAGEMAVVVGPSGCGKTTLLRLIAGLDQPDAGTVRIGGQPVDHLPPDRRGVAMVFQSHALYPHMTVAENMGFALRLAGRPRSEIAAAVARIAALLQLEPLLARRPAALSGGQRQRVAIGRAILRDPRVFLFDEPLSSLDPGLRATLRAEIAALKDRLPDRTMILVTHDQAEAMVLADQLVVMAAGAIEQAGSPVEVYQRPRTSFVARFIGAPGMNLLPAKVIGIGDQARLRLAGDGEVVCPLPLRAEDLGREVLLGVRPEDLRPAAGPGLLGGRVTRAEGLGEATLAHLDTAAGQVVARLPGLHPGLRHQWFDLQAAPDRLHLFVDGLSVLHR